MKTTGNLILMTTICVVIFWVFMAIQPAPAQSSGPGGYGSAFGGGLTGGYRGGGGMVIPTPSVTPAQSACVRRVASVNPNNGPALLRCLRRR